MGDESNDGGSIGRWSKVKQAAAVNVL